MAAFYQSTLLAQSNESIEIQKADLDLLKKINELIPTKETFTKKHGNKKDAYKFDVFKYPDGRMEQVGWVQSEVNSLTGTVGQSQSWLWDWAVPFIDIPVVIATNNTAYGELITFKISENTTKTGSGIWEIVAVAHAGIASVSQWKYNLIVKGYWK